MSELKTLYQEQIQTIYGFDGIEFPDSFFGLGDFVLSLSTDEQEDFWSSLLNVYPTGLFQCLLDLAQGTFTRPENAHSAVYWRVCDRYYMDVPEFFTCFITETAGEHLGLLLDDPSVGFRGVGYFFNADPSPMNVYDSILEMINCRFDDAMEACEQWIEDDYDVETYHGFLELAQLWKPRFNQFISDNGLNLHDNRPEGIQSQTGLSIIPANHLSAEQSQRAIELLEEGRCLWYWDENSEEENIARTNQARDRMQAAYELMERSKLIVILNEAHEERLHMIQHRQGRS